MMLEVPFHYGVHWSSGWQHLFLANGAEMRYFNIANLYSVVFLS